MPINESLIAELQAEAAATRKILERVPEKSFSWKPHDKSMSLGRLAYHIAENSKWVNASVDEDGIDFSKMDFEEKEAATSEELLKVFDEYIASAIDCLKKASDEKLLGSWTMRNGEQIYFTMPKTAVIRSFVLNHTIHHRGQLSVYLRLLDVPLPQIYGPTADESNF